MNKTYCNPLDLNYRYQHFVVDGKRFANREAADPTLVLYKGTYYLFASMSGGFWYSDDLLDWKFHENRNLPIYDYAPDVRQVGDYLVFCASRHAENCPILRTSDPLSDKFEEVSAPFPFWDPDMFEDEDGRVYFYWGCSNTSPIYGVEMDRNTLTPITEPAPMLQENDANLGYERFGENGVVVHGGPLYELLCKVKDPVTGEINLPDMPDSGSGFKREDVLRRLECIDKPYIEGAFMTKHGGKYYLQYACPGTQFNTYADGVYVSDKPLGPFVLQEANPYSSKPGGFMQGAGHGSTIADRHGNYWHISTMRISVNHNFERRVGLWPAGFDKDGLLFCNQNFGDYPVRIPEGRFDPWSVKPEWMLLSYRKPVTASSAEEGHEAELAVNEDTRSWWSAAGCAGEWLTLDLEREMDVRAIQVNLADEGIDIPHEKEQYVGREPELRYIEELDAPTVLLLEASADGSTWRAIREIDRSCANAYEEFPEGVSLRYLRVTAKALPFGQALRISGLRVFGNGAGEKPARAVATAERTGAMDGLVRWEEIPGAQGVNIRYGIAPDKLYSAWMVYGGNEQNLSTLMRGKAYYLRVDSFNENGITEGDLITLPAEP